MLRAWSERPSFVTEEFMKKLVLGVATLALSAGVASAQVVYPGYSYAPYGYGYYDYAPYGYGYAYGYGAPLYAYAATGFYGCYPTFDYSTGWNEFCPGSGYVFGPGYIHQ
jgi:hypothetical protein